MFAGVFHLAANPGTNSTSAGVAEHIAADMMGSTGECDKLQGTDSGRWGLTKNPDEDFKKKKKQQRAV
jgi:hypothetical protein